MDAPSKEFALAGSLEELKIKGRLVVHAGSGARGSKSLHLHLPLPVVLFIWNRLVASGVIKDFNR
jgi:hypothetical protein